MSESNREPVFSFESEIKNDGTIELPVEKFNEMKKSGNGKVKVAVYLQKVSRNDIDPVMFEKIRQIQSLPEDVVEDFLDCKSALRETNFGSKVKY